MTKFCAAKFLFNLEAKDGWRRKKAGDGEITRLSQIHAK